MSMCVGIHGLLLLGRDRLRGDRQPVYQALRSRSNSSPQPELSVRANPPTSTFTVPGVAWCQPNPDPSPTHQQRHHQSGHHRHRRYQHPDLAGSWETCRLTNGTAPSKRTIVPAASRCAPAPTRRLTRSTLVIRLLVDQSRIQGEQRLRAAAVQAGVTAVDVDGDRGSDQRGEARRQQAAVELLGRCEQALDGDLVLASFGGVGIGAAGRVDAHDPGGQQRLRVVGPPLHGLGTDLPVGEDDGERRRVTVALQVHPVAADPQRVVDLQPVGPPTVSVRSRPD